MNRRSFLALASGILVRAPEPVRAYSFVGGWKHRREMLAMLPGVRSLDHEVDEVLAQIRAAGMEPLVLPRNVTVEFCPDPFDHRPLRIVRVPYLGRTVGT